MTDHLSDIHHYSPNLTIANVIKFCEKKGLPISRPMIQNYIRDGLLPPPVDKRIYTHKHLAALVVISHLKTVCDLPIIKEALAPHMDEEGLPLETYKWFMSKQNDLMALWLTHVAPTAAAQPNDNQSLLLLGHLADIKAVL